jgi:hypothetical protein
MSTRTSYQEAGTLQRPGPIGRAVRLLFGLGAFYALFQAVKYRAAAEHHCPAGPIDRLDRWELGLRRRG